MRNLLFSLFNLLFIISLYICAIIVEYERYFVERR